MASTASKAATIGKQAKTDLPEAALQPSPTTSRSSTRPRRADLNARRQGTHSSLTRGEVAMTGAKAWRQKGTGRARVGALSVPHRRGGGDAFATEAAPLHLQGQPQGAPQGAALGAQRPCRPRLASPCSRPTASPSPPTTQAAEGLAKWGGAMPTLVVITAEEARRRQELPQPARASRSSPPRRSASPRSSGTAR